MAGRVAAAGAFGRGVTEAADKTAANDGDTPVYNLFKFTVPADDKTFFCESGKYNFTTSLVNEAGTLSMNLDRSKNNDGEVYAVEIYKNQATY